VRSYAASPAVRSALALVGAPQLKPDLVIKPMISLDRARRDL